MIGDPGLSHYAIVDLGSGTVPTAINDIGQVMGVARSGSASPLA